MASRKDEKKQRREARQAAEAERARGARRRRRWRIGSLAVGGVVLVGLVAVVVAVNSAGGGAAPVRSADPVLGDPAAPVTIVEYGDFKCPSCTSFFLETEPRLRREYIETGKARLVWRDFPVIDAESAPAAEAARCAGAQGRFWEYHDALYRFIWDNFYGRGVNAEGGSAYAGNYDRLARRAGVRDLAAFRRCRESGTYRDAVLAARDDGAAQGVDGTPTFFINGQRLVGAQPYDVFRRLIEAELGDS